MLYHVFSINRLTKKKEYFITVGGDIAKYKQKDAEFEVHTMTKLYAAENTDYGLEQVK